jgi:hypothetical protein
MGRQCAKNRIALEPSGVKMHLASWLIAAVISLGMGVALNSNGIVVEEVKIKSEPQKRQNEMRTLTPFHCQHAD